MAIVNILVKKKKYIEFYCYSDAATEICEKEQQLRNANADLNRVQQDLETVIRARDMAYQENR